MSDLINRQDLVDVLQERYKLYDWDDGGAEKAEVGAIIREIFKFPSAQRNGHWILHQDSRTWECSECHKYQVIWSNYCMHCGADMRGEDDE